MGSVAFLTDVNKNTRFTAVRPCADLENKHTNMLQNQNSLDKHHTAIMSCSLGLLKQKKIYSSISWASVVDERNLSRNTGSISVAHMRAGAVPPVFLRPFNTLNYSTLSSLNAIFLSSIYFLIISEHNLFFTVLTWVPVTTLLKLY